jgi:hypothetical protein
MRWDESSRERKLGIFPISVRNMSLISSGEKRGRETGRAIVTIYCIAGQNVIGGFEREK